MTHTTSVADAFSRKSAVYDAFGEDHPNLTRMRQRVYAAVTRHLEPGSHLLEINAGTGLDASAIVQHGHTVHATDLAPGMINAIEQKIETHRLGDRLTAQQLSFTELDQVKQAPFDGVYSNFGGLNCVADLRAVTQHLPKILRQGGIAVWVIMPPICPWEMALCFKDWQVATRRFRKNGVVANVEGVDFRTWYFTPGRVIKAFGPQFECIGLEGLSVVTPSADNKTFAVKHPSLFKQMVRLDEAISPYWPFNRMGDFFILTMRLRS
ncbi:MAG: class I SAM-dependent methyltransferase [Anaerolineae bacterium]